MNLRVKIGDAQFEASGENIGADYDRWIAEITKQERRKIADEIARLETQLRYQRRRLVEFDKPSVSR